MRAMMVAGVARHTWSCPDLRVRAICGGNRGIVRGWQTQDCLHAIGGSVMGVNGRYDGDLQMLVEAPREANREHLLFLRWLAERGRLEHAVAGPPLRCPVQEWTKPGECPDVLR
jgi:hypothetical protein